MIAYYVIKFLKKKFIKGLKKTGGRCNLGRVTVRGRGGGNKVNYRVLDFYRRLNQYGMLIRILYDPNRSGKLGLIIFENSFSCLILIQNKMKIRDVIFLGSYKEEDGEEIKNGYSLPLFHMPLFSILSNIELKPFNGGAICRAASTSSMLIGKTKNKGILKLKSNWELHLPLNCMSSYGSISSKLLNNMYIKKAGKSRGLGFKPKVRGVAKNPCDHPHGGGNGKRSKPKIPVNA
jgi:large subunit ribosomal protein L2